jgi:NAD(P)-dependent dehydrogenase (short-subunit alcohol dehydrogenase family)
MRFEPLLDGTVVADAWSYRAVMSAGTNMTARAEANTRLGPLADAEEMAAAALWLCSDVASYLTGSPCRSTADGWQ